MNLSGHDKRIIIRGIAALMATVIIGLSVAESQLNSLTKHQECVQIINLKRDIATGTYTAYMLGSGYSFAALIPVAAVRNNDYALYIGSDVKRWTIPTKIIVDWQQAIYWFAVWRNQFLQEAVKTKRNLTRGIEHFRQIIDNVAKSFKREG